MKSFYLNKFGAFIVMMLTSFTASSYDFDLDEIYYSIISNELKTVEVVNNGSKNSYSGGGVSSSGSGSSSSSGGAVVVTKPDTTIILTIDKLVSTVNGQEIISDVAPIIVDGRTYTPARFVAEQLGAKVDWNEETQLVTVTGKDGIVIELRIGSNVALVNGKPVGSPLLSIADGDLQTFNEKIGAGKKKQGVLLFEVSKSAKIASVEVQFGDGSRQANVSVH